MGEEAAGAIHVDIWSDVVCPWCYIGKRKFEAGVAAFSAERRKPAAIDVEYHSFELSPDMPADFDGDAVAFLVRHKGLAETQVRQMHQNVTAVAAEVGLHYDFESLQPANTVRAHQVLHLAKAHRLQEPMKERLLAAHFLEGRHVGREEELAGLAAEVGLDPAAVQRSLREGSFLPDVREDQQTAYRLGIRGVPFFVFDGRYGISGAQPPAVFVDVLRRVVDEASTPAD